MVSEPATEALHKLLGPLASSLDPAALQSLVDYHADVATQQRVDDLADRCNAGVLTPEEQSEYDALVDASRVLAVLKVEAKKRLHQSPDAA